MEMGNSWGQDFLGSGTKIWDRVGAESKEELDRGPLLNQSIKKAVHFCILLSIGLWKRSVQLLPHPNMRQSDMYRGWE